MSRGGSSLFEQKGRGRGDLFGKGGSLIYTPRRARYKGRNIAIKEGRNRALFLRGWWGGGTSYPYRGELIPT